MESGFLAENMPGCRHAPNNHRFPNNFLLFSTRKHFTFLSIRNHLYSKLVNSSVEVTRWLFEQTPQKKKGYAVQLGKMFSICWKAC